MDDLPTKGASKAETRVSVDGKWEHVETNLLRYISSGVYYVKCKVHGRRIRESLKTDNLILARQLKSNFLAKVQGTGKTVRASSRATMGALIETYRGDIEHNKRLKPRAREYKLDCCDDLHSTWKGIHARRIQTITKREVVQWRNRNPMSPSRINGQLTCLRELFVLAEEKGFMRGDSPAASVKGVPQEKKLLNLPPKADFEKFRARVLYKSPEGGILFDLLHLSGARVDSARHLQYGHIVWSTLDAKGKKVRGTVKLLTTKRDNYEIPLFDDLEEFLLRIRPPNWKPSDKVSPVKSIKRVLETTSEELGIDITHHVLRHWFATRCIERGVDIPTVSRWLGHRDGGVLAMRTYGHLRKEHEESQAAKV